jgi:hypothetical protein
VARIGGETLTGPHIPLHANSSPGELTNLNVNVGPHWTEGWLGIEMGNAMLALDRVVGLATIHPVAIHADTHAA